MQISSDAANTDKQCLVQFALQQAQFIILYIYIYVCVCVCCQEVLDKTTSTCKDRIVFRDDELSYALGKEAYLYGK